MNRLKNFYEFYKTVNIVYFAIVGGLLLFMTTSYFLSVQQNFDINTNQNQIILGGSLAIILSFAAQYFFRISLKKIDTKADIKDKFSGYFNAFIIKLALLEGAAMVNIVFFYASANKIYLIFAGFILLLLLLAKANPDKISTELKLNSEEKAYINQPEKYFSDF